MARFSSLLYLCELYLVFAGAIFMNVCISDRSANLRKDTAGGVFSTLRVVACLFLANLNDVLSIHTVYACIMILCIDLVI